MESTKLMRARARELAKPATDQDDYDRAVLATLDDFDHMLDVLARLVKATDARTTLADERKLMPDIVAAAIMIVAAP